VMINMMSMGMTIKLQDFRNLVKDARNGRALAFVLVVQFFLTPVMGKVLSLFVGQYEEGNAGSFVGGDGGGLSTGIILLSIMPTSQVSNVAAYIAGGNVALSVSMSMVSICASLVLVPLVFRVLSNTEVVMNDRAQLISIVRTALLPVLLGASLNTWKPSVTDAVRPIIPICSVMLSALIAAIPISGFQGELAHGGMAAAVPVLLLALGNYAIAHAAAPRLGLDHALTKTVALEVAMKSAMLAYMLGMNQFQDESNFPSHGFAPAYGVFIFNWLGAVYAAYSRYKMGSFADLLPADAKCLFGGVRVW